MKALELVIITIPVLMMMRPLTVFLHEMGHAIPAALLTGSKKIDVYVGSFGDDDNSWHFGKGRFRFHFKYRPLDWTHGLCRYDTGPGKDWLRDVITLGGPLASFVLGALCLFHVLYFDMHGYLQFLAWVFISSAIYDLVWNLKPSDQPLALPDGTATYNDGYQLVMRRKLKKFYPDLEEALLHVQNKKDEEAVRLADRIAENVKPFAPVSQTLAFIYCATGSHNKAIEISTIAEENGIASGEIFHYKALSLHLTKRYAEAAEYFSKAAETLNASDVYYNRGCNYLAVERYEEALMDFERSAAMDPGCANRLNNLGYVLTALERYSEAIEPLNKAIQVNASLAAAYNNRGLAKIKTGDRDGGYKDIMHSIGLDHHNAHSYRNAGIYYLEGGDLSKALENFNKANEIDPDIPMLKDLLEDTRRKLTV